MPPGIFPAESAFAAGDRGRCGGREYSGTGDTVSSPFLSGEEDHMVTGILLAVDRGSRSL